MSNDFVREGYNQAAENYSASRNQFENTNYLEKLNQLVTPDSTILDIGCGAGEPVDAYLVAHGHHIIGIDLSDKQIELAKSKFPHEHFEVKDMSLLRRNEYTVHAVVSFYAIFHIPRQQHHDLFRKINSFLPVGGLILVTMGSSDWEGTEEDFHGVKMYWSHYDRNTNRELIEQAGFEILLDEIDDTGNERHQVVMAKKSA